MPMPCHANPKQNEPAVYAINIDGHLSDQWTDRFGGMEITLLEDGTTLLSGKIVDQAALHGLLRTIRDLGLPLISVVRIAPPSDI